jgi:hypothetical protein
MLRPRKRQKQATTVAVGCDWLPRAPNGKDGVDGSSPSEGFTKRPAYRGSLLSTWALVSCWRTHFGHQLVARVAAWARRHARERLGIEADEIDGGHYITLSRPLEQRCQHIASFLGTAPIG